MKNFGGVYVFNGRARRLTFEADDEEEALSISTKWNVGLSGETLPPGVAPAPVPDVYDLRTAARLLGNISHATIYRWVKLGRLERIPDTRKVLITRQSVERLVGSA